MEPRADLGTMARPDDDPRVISAKLVNAIYRLVKACQIHAENNNAVAQVVDFVVSSIADYCGRANVASAAILFTPNAVFVNRQMLRASRETYQLALELGQMLEPCGVTEITLSNATTAAEVAEFGRVVADFIRLGKPSPRFAEGGWDGVKLRKVQGLTFSTNVSPPMKAARTYAAALMIVRGFYSDLKQGKYELKQGIKRVAQKLVSQNESGGRLLLSIAAAPPADSDRAGLALSSAIVALAMASQLTDDRTLLSGLASAALMFDVGRPRLVGYDEGPDARAVRQLNAEEVELLPTSSLVALAALGKFHPPNLTRSVIVHEALLLSASGTPYGGRRQPSLMARILATARAFSELRVPKGTTPALAIDDALQVIEGQARDSTDRTLLKLLIGALGIFPAGTMVELSTGEMGVVLATPALPVDFARPPVRIMYDAQAQLLEQPIDVDLASPPVAGEPVRYVKRPIDTTDQQMKQMRAYVVQLAATRSRKNSVAKMRAVMAKGDAPSSAGSAPSSSASVPSWGSSGSFSDAANALPSASPISGGSAASSQISHGDFSPPPPSATGAPARDSRAAPTARPPTRQFDGRPDAEPQPSASSRGVAVPSPDGIKHKPGSTRALGWDEYGRELASSASGGGPVPAPDLNDTDALLAAYLSEDALEAVPVSSGGRRDPISSSGPHLAPGRHSSQGHSSQGHSSQGHSSQGHSSQGHSSSHGANPPSTSGIDTQEARSFGLRWAGDRPSSQGTNTPTAPPMAGSPMGGAARATTGGGFNSPGRATTGSGRPTGEPPPTSHPISASVERVSSGFGASGRATNTAGLRLGREPKSSQGAVEQDPFSAQSSGGLSNPGHGGTKLGVGSSGDHAWTGPKNRPTGAPPPDPEGFSFEERPFDQPAVTSRRAPLRGSMTQGSAPAAPEPPQARPAAAAPPPSAPSPESPPSDEQAAASLPVSRRGKAGSMNWGAPRRNDKK